VGDFLQIRSNLWFYVVIVSTILAWSCTFHSKFR